MRNMTVKITSMRRQEGPDIDDDNDDSTADDGKGEPRG
jgi:hypothetical protein